MLTSKLQTLPTRGSELWIVSRAATVGHGTLASSCACVCLVEPMAQTPLSAGSVLAAARGEVLQSRHSIVVQLLAAGPNPISQCVDE
jgi:hypothetical protein